MVLYYRNAIILFSVFILQFLSGWPSACGSTLEGTIRMEPPYPERAAIPVEEKYHHCGTAQTSQRFLVGPNGEIQNAVISLAGEFPQQKPENRGQPPILAQRGCQFLPHVLLVPRNQPFLITNEDPMAHDVRAFLGNRMLTRFEMDAGDPPVERHFMESGTLVIRCGLHKWMHAFVISMGHPYYTLTNERGEFQLAHLPPGQFQVKIWHEVLGEIIRSVTLQEESPHRMDFTYTTTDPQKS